MTKTPDTRDAASVVAASVLLLVVPFWSYVHFHRYDPLRSDSLAIAAGLAIVGTRVGVTTARTHGAVARTLLTAILLFISADLLADVGRYHVLLLGALLVVSWLLRTHVHRITIAVMLAVLLTGLVAGGREAPALQPSRGTPRQGTRPPLLHLIADEHIGVDAIPTGVPGGAEAKAALVAFYVQHGFRLFTRAYSPYHLTADAIPNALNCSERSEGLAWLGAGRPVVFPARLKHNAYFDRLSDVGFDVRTYQPGFLDFCGTTGAPPVSCFMVPANSVGNVPALTLRWGARARLIVQHWLANNSSLYDLSLIHI